MHVLVVLSVRTEPHLRAALVQMVGVVDGPWFQAAVHFVVLRAVRLRMPIRDMDPVGQIGNVRQLGLPCGGGLLQ